jgi:hypothetical protein
MKFLKNFKKKNKDKWWFKYPKKLLKIFLFSGLPFIVGLYLGNGIVCVNHYFSGDYLFFHLTDYKITVERLDKLEICPETDEFSIFVQNNWYGQNTFKHKIYTIPQDNHFNFTFSCKDELGNFKTCPEELNINGNSNFEIRANFYTGKCEVSTAKVCVKIEDVQNSNNYAEECKDVDFKN